jgi:hypothetical protein
MSRTATAIVALVVGTVLGVVLLAGVCSLPTLAGSSACGHNTPIWLPIVVPLCIGACWFALLGLVAQQSSNSRAAGVSSLYKCAGCGALVAGSAPSCKECGFVFGVEDRAV